MLEATMQTCIGSRPSNQDRMFAKTEIISGEASGLFCVADGMGGYEDGHIAAETAVSAVAEWWEKRDACEFSALFAEINREIHSCAAARKNTLGTTLSLLYICNNAYYIAHTGDSRIYLIRKKFFRRVTTILTQDQTWASDKLREGKIPLAEIHSNPDRNRLTGCLGIYDKPKIYTASGQIKKRDTFILCTDGLYRTLDPKILARAAQKNSAESAKILINAAVSSGAKDNASVVVVNLQ